MRQLSGQDASFLYLESQGAFLHVTAVYVYKQSTKPGEALGFEDIVDHIASRLDSAELFRQKLVRPPLDVDYPYWVDDSEFDLNRHIHRHEKAVTERQDLYDMIGALHTEPLDLTIPPWEMHVFEHLEQIEGFPDHCFAIIAKYHHAAVDGASGSQLVDGLHDTRATVAVGKAGDRWQADREPGFVELLARAAFNNTRIQIKMASSLSKAVPGVARSLLKPGKKDTEKKAAVPDTRFNDAVSPDRVFHAITFNLDQVKKMRTAHPGATVNDVVLTICGGALRTWLEDLDELPGESLVAMVPVNARSLEETELGGNKLATMFIPIHTDLADPVERLGAIYRATSKAKSESEEAGVEQMSEVTNQLPAITISSAGKLITGLGLGHRIMRLANCTITNVPGPKKPLYFGPAKLIWSTGTAPIINGMGLIICVFSYEEEITFSYTSCRKMMPDSNFLAACLQNEFDALSGLIA